jgi:hypothetical protein
VHERTRAASAHQIEATARAARLGAIGSTGVEPDVAITVTSASRCVESVADELRLG